MKIRVIKDSSYERMRYFQSYKIRANDLKHSKYKMTINIDYLYNIIILFETTSCLEVNCTAVDNYSVE